MNEYMPVYKAEKAHLFQYRWILCMAKFDSVNMIREIQAIFAQ